MDEKIFKLISAVRGLELPVGHRELEEKTSELAVSFSVMNGSRLGQTQANNSAPADIDLTVQSGSVAYRQSTRNLEAAHYHL